MKQINALIVVEGKSDIDHLSSFIDADFYLVNGSAINQKDFDFINEYSKKKDVIVLTDPDYPGLRIRNLISLNCKNVKHAYVKKECSIKNHKVGVAECDKEEILKALHNVIDLNNTKISSNLKESDMFLLGLIGKNDSKNKRKKISDAYHLGYNNAKQLYKKLVMLGINKEEIEEFLNA